MIPPISCNPINENARIKIFNDLVDNFEQLINKKWYSLLTQSKDTTKDMDSYIPNKDLFNTTRGYVPSTGNKQIINLFNLNDYLGMSKDLRVIASVYAASMVYGTGGLGSRLLRGTTDLHVCLEEKLSKFKGLGKKNIGTITFPSGYMANLALMSLIREENATVIVDKKAQQSLIDGCLLSGVRIKRFAHNDMDHLEKLIKKIRSRICTRYHQIVIVVDGIYSMDGDFSPLVEIKQLADKYGTLIILDDAHSTGTVGDIGRGTLEKFKINDWQDNVIIMGTLGKSLGSIGGFVTARSDIIKVLKFTANQVIYSTALTPANVAAALTSLELIENNDARLKQLQCNAKTLKQGIIRMGMNIGATKTHIIPLMLTNKDKKHYHEDDEKKIFMLSKELLSNGYYAPPVTKPAVQVPRLRISVASIHTKEQIDGFLNTMRSSTLF